MHNDTQSLHVHSVIGAINLETGKKMHGNWHEYRERLVKITDKVVKSHGLSVTVPQIRPEKRSMAEIKMKARDQLTWKDQIRNAIDTTMSDARIIDFKSFKDKLMAKAVNVYERGKELTYELTGTKYKARGSKLGDDYKKETIKNELDRRYERQYGTGREPDNAWLNGRGERAQKEQQARRGLKERAERAIRDYEQRTAERIALEMQNLKNQKERDMEDLAYKIAQQLQNNSDDIYQKYIESSKTTFESLRVDIQREINKNTANLSMLSDQNKKYDRAVTVLRYNNQNQDKKELIFNVAMAVGLVLVSISVLIFAFLFFSTLSGFGLKQIMSLTILKYQAPTWQVALGYVFKVFLALLFYFGGLILILSPILIYQKFLKFISTKYFGFGGKLKTFS